MSRDSAKHISITMQLVFYYAIIAAFVVGAFFPESRIWGINYGAYLPIWAKLTLLALTAIMPMLLMRINWRKFDDSFDNNRKFWLVVGSVTLCLTGLFYLLRAKSFYLGDGYALLGLLESDNPLVKTREIGEAWSHIWLKNLIGGDPKQAALLSYQIISVGAGTLFLTIASFFSYKLFERNLDRILFLLGLVSGGYMLLFFGYVENYSLFVVTVLLFCCSGLMIVRKVWSRWLTVPMLGLCILMHIFGITLLPAAIYLLVSGSSLGNKLSRISGKTKWLLALLAIIPIGMVFYHYYTTAYFFRFALLSPFEDRFTVDGYTLFSLSHLVDFLNLLILLVPALPLFVLVLVKRLSIHSIKKSENLFLLLLTLSAFGAAFIFDPKLGMARDWDLFAFAGLPLVMLLLNLWLEADVKPALRISVVTLAVVLGFAGLTARAVVVADKDAGFQQFSNLIKLDHTRSRNSYLLVINYYRSTSDSQKLEQASQRWMNTYPEVSQFRRGRELKERGQFSKAIEALTSATKISPYFFEAWLVLADAQMLSGNPVAGLESHLIADGLNPYHTANLNSMGYLYMVMGEWDEARDIFRRVIAIEPKKGIAYYNLLTTYLKLQETDQYQLCFAKMIKNIELNQSSLQVAITVLGGNQDFHTAGLLADEAVASGIDPAFVRELLSKYPQVRVNF